MFIFVLIIVFSFFFFLIMGKLRSRRKITSRSLEFFELNWNPDAEN